jgi:TrpR-related protein YerC/YecD
MNAQISERDMNLICDAFLCLDSKNEVKKFLSDLLTPKELTSVVERMKIAKKVHTQTPYRQIAETLKCSTTTVTKVANRVNQGQGGYLKVLERI